MNTIGRLSGLWCATILLLMLSPGLRAADPAPVFDLRNDATQKLLRDAAAMQAQSAAPAEEVEPQPTAEVDVALKEQPEVVQPARKPARKSKPPKECRSFFCGAFDFLLETALTNALGLEVDDDEPYDSQRNFNSRPITDAQVVLPRRP